jgi:tRNA G18 (ribose-2'-O)-methylase SpoU
MKNMKQTIVVLENIRSVHNVGSVFRTADGAGIQKIICCGYTPTPEHKDIHKVALGSEHSIAWEQNDSAFLACKQLQEEGYEICVLETNQNAENIFSTQFQKSNIVLVFGHEVEGVTTPILSIANRILRIPMRGIKESLNVSVSAGIAMYIAQER